MPVRFMPRGAMLVVMAMAMAMAMVMALAPCGSARAADITGELSGKLLAAGDKRVMILSSTGAVEWEHPTGLVHDAWLLPSGNVLYADGATVTEVAPDHKIVFQYKSPEQKGGGTYACQRLADGRTLIAENSTGKILEVDAAGKVVFGLQTAPFTAGQHHNMRIARKLSNGNYLVCHSGAKRVKEYTPQGQVVLELQTPNVAFTAVRTAKNTTLVASLSKLLEFDAAGKVVWEFENTALPGVKISNLTGLHLLAGGNIVTGCYRAYDKGEGTGLLEITPDKKLVWRLANPRLAGTMMAVQKLDAAGKPLPGQTQR